MTSWSLPIVLEVQGYTIWDPLSFAMPLNIGDPAPSFKALTTSGEEISLENLQGKKVILYFYPKDDTPGCTKEACGFRDQWSRYQEQGITVLGVSKDSVASHQKFAQKYTLPFPLLSDPDAAMASAYGVWGEKKFMGKTYMGVNRTTFLIDENGKIAHIWSKVKTDTHAEDVLSTLT
jgi:peroxiredoxin Q/BCP